jgi:monoamine oxidase
MAKSPLLRTLQRAYKIIRLSRKSGIPENELLGILKETRNSNARLSRRRLLQGGVALAGFSAASTFSWVTGDRASAQSQTNPVLVVGAGISGLTAAYRLRQAGVPVNVIEATGRIGGRMRSLRNAAGTSITAELGGELINTDHSCLLGLAKELGIKVVDVQPFHEGLSDTSFFEGRKLSMEEIIKDFTPIARKISADLKKIENFENYTTVDKYAIALDRLSISEYLERISTSKTIRSLIEIAYNVEYGREADEQSCLNMLYLIGTGTDEFKVTGDSDERFYIEGGNDLVPYRLAELLSDSIETGTALESIRTISDGRYRVTLQSGNRTIERTYERIVLTIPFSVLRHVNLKVDLPPVKRLAINTLGYGTNAKLITGYREKIWRTRYKASGAAFTDLGFQDSWESAESRYTEEPGLITNLTGGRQGVKVGLGKIPVLTEKLVLQLDRVFPGIKAEHLPSQAARSYWSTDPYIQGSYACYLPGQWTQFHGAEQERVGNLFFAGDSVSLENQGFMEGGCETGEAAAIAILKDLGLKSEVTQHSSLT